MRLVDWFQDKFQPLKNKLACKKGKHRWGHITEKRPDGEKETVSICQDCGAIDASV